MRPSGPLSAPRRKPRGREVLTMMDELDSQGNVVRRGFVPGMWDNIAPGHTLVPHVPDVPPTPPAEQIAAIERVTLMNRATREFLLALAEKEGTAAGLTQAQLYQANVAYRVVKDIDTQIVALRALIPVP